MRPLFFGGSETLGILGYVFNDFFWGKRVVGVTDYGHYSIIDDGIVYADFLNESKENTVELTKIYE